MPDRVITAGEVEALAEAEAKATPGPWVWRAMGTPDYEPTWGVLEGPEGEEQQVICHGCDGASVAQNDLPFIQKARDALPALLAFVRRAEALLGSVSYTPEWLDAKDTLLAEYRGDAK
jgi:hypothetical protein